MRRVLLACFVLLGPFVAGASAQSVSRAEQALLRKIERWVAQGKSERAVRELARAVAKSPTDALLARYAELALPCSAPADHEREQTLQRAAALLLAALERRVSDPLSSGLVPAAVWAQALQGEYEQSLALASSAARADDPRTLPCLRACAALAVRRGEPERARATLSLARNFAPSDPRLTSELGLLLLAEGDAAAALAPLAERFALDPSSLGARRDLAYALSAAGRPDEALALLRVASERCALEPSCLLEQARWALEAGRADEALRAARALLVRQPEHVDALFLSADALLLRGALAQARVVYQTILRIAPHSLRAKSALSALEAAPASRP